MHKNIAVLDLQKFGWSLKQYTRTVIGKKFSKFEQCSAWNYRPLRRAQLHYAALDARILLDIYDKKVIGYWLGREKLLLKFSQNNLRDPRSRKERNQG
jgi:hypothetical protein